MFGAKQDEKVKKDYILKYNLSIFILSYNIPVASRQKDNPKYCLLVKFRIRSKEYIVF